MHASPETIKLEFLKLWVSYHCYRQKGPFLVVYGHQLADPENDGACGACPFSYLNVYHLNKDGQATKQVQSLMKNHRYVTIDDNEVVEKTWGTLSIAEVQGMEHDFQRRGQGL